LVETIEAIGLDPAAATREMTPLPCVGAGAGTEGYNIRYYFDASDDDQAAEQVAALEGHWEQTEGVEITERMGDPGEIPDFLGADGRTGARSHAVPGLEGAGHWGQHRVLVMGLVAP
jgi:hypothetical protein